MMTTKKEIQSEPCIMCCGVTEVENVGDFTAPVIGKMLCWDEVCTECGFRLTLFDKLGGRA